MENNANNIYIIIYWKFLLRVKFIQPKFIVGTVIVGIFGKENAGPVTDGRVGIENDGKVGLVMVGILGNVGRVIVGMLGNVTEGTDIDGNVTEGNVGTVNDGNVGMETEGIVGIVIVGILNCFSLILTGNAYSAPLKKNKIKLRQIEGISF